MAMFIVANLLGSTVQISTLPLPVLSTLQASGLVFNSICATIILGEPFTRWSLWGTLLVCTGAVLIAVFGAIPAPAHNLTELLELLGRRPFVIWMSLQAVFVVAVALATDLTSHLTNHGQNARFRLVRGLAYGLISGILSAHSLLVAKSAVELIVRTVSDRSNQFVHWQSWMLVLALVALALTQLYYLHRGLKLVSTSVLYPLVFCVYNIIAILDGLIYFRQADLITPLHACLIALGTAILLSGVLALSWRLSAEQHPPAVGQSTLAPGLGLVEDTEGEEEDEPLAELGEESPLLSRAPAEVVDLEAAAGATATADAARPSPYRTFGGVEVTDAIPPTPSSRHSRVMAAGRAAGERAEIWGELEDEEAPLAPKPGSPLHARRRSTTTLPPVGEHGGIFLPQPPQRRVTSGPAGGAEDGAGVPRRGLRRRRRSMGFPGFTARRTRRPSTTGGESSTVAAGSSGGGLLQGGLGEFFRLRSWLRRTESAGTNAALRVDPEAAATASGPVPASTRQHHQQRQSASHGRTVQPSEAVSAGRGSWPPYRDDPDPLPAASGGGSSVGRGDS